MGTTVQEAAKKTYTDASGTFYEGMTREETEGKYSIFYFMNQEKEFNRIDKDGDGTLSKFEITEELKSDIESTKKAVKLNAGCGIAFGLLGWASHNKVSKKTALFNLGITLYGLGAAVWSKIHADNLEKRVAQGCN